MVTVREELEHIKSYLTIQKARYEDKLHYEILYTDEVLQYNVLKLVLQPLVENAIYHGIHARRGGGTITITAKVEGEKLHFTVEDNGMGMKEEKVKEINTFLKRPRTDHVSSSGFGIFNVNERIRLSFGTEYGLEYTSVYTEGTRVDLWHPLL